MKNFFKSLIVTSFLLFAAFNSAQALTVTTNVTVGGPIILLSAPAKISQVQVLAGNNNVIVSLYDNNNAVTNFTNQAYATLVQFVTNQTYTFISPLTGTTNLQTNSYLFEGVVTNAANTNNPLPHLDFPAQANTLATYPINFIASRGIMVNPTTNCAVVITYRVND